MTSWNFTISPDLDFCFGLNHSLQPHALWRTIGWSAFGMFWASWHYMARMKKTVFRSTNTNLSNFGLFFHALVEKKINLKIWKPVEIFPMFVFESWARIYADVLPFHIQWQHFAGSASQNVLSNADTGSAFQWIIKVLELTRFPWALDANTYAPFWHVFHIHSYYLKGRVSQTNYSWILPVGHKMVAW